MHDYSKADLTACYRIETGEDVDPDPYLEKFKQSFGPLLLDDDVLVDSGYDFTHGVRYYKLTGKVKNG